MAEIAPFRGILYDTSRVDASRVLAPPYDVIDDNGREALVAKDPHNCVRLILPKGESKYDAARQTFDEWRSGGVLRRDDRPAVYRYHQVFDSAELGRTITRRGFIAAGRLHRFDEGVVLPHERTLKGPKIDRLELMKATSAHLSQIFTMYSDPSGETERIFTPAESRTPDLDGVTDDGTRHRLWRVDDAEAIGKLERLLAPLKLYIADGHHRYETMVALRDHFREQAGGDLDERSVAQFGTFFLANMDDPGLVVLPIHRLVHSLQGFSKDRLLDSAGAWFDIEPMAEGARDPLKLRDHLTRCGEERPSFAALFPGDPDAHILSLKAGFDPAAAGIEEHPAVAWLDVTLLHSLVLENVLGIDRAALEAQTNITYVKDTASALERTEAGEGQVCFVMNPTRLEQVRAVADARGFMPQKSTFFYPKIASGVVFNRIDTGETL